MTRNPLFLFRLPGKSALGQAILPLIAALLMTVGSTSPSLAQGAQGPDLFVDLARTSIRTPSPGSGFIITVGIQNQGTRASGPATVRFYQSTDGTIDGDTINGDDTLIMFRNDGDDEDDRLRSERNIGVIQLGEPSTFTRIGHSIATAGNHYVGACVTVSGDTDTDNNCSRGVWVAVTEPPPLVEGVDLFVNWATTSIRTPRPGAGFIITARIENQGKVASGATDVRFYQSTDNTIDGDTINGDDTLIEFRLDGDDEDDRLRDSIGIGGIEPRRTSNVLRIGHSIATAGNYFVGACVAPVSGETVRDNNCSYAVRVVVTPPPGPPDNSPRPNLFVHDINVSESMPEAGVPFTITATVRNDGDAASGATSLRYYSRSGDEDEIYDDEEPKYTELATVAVGGLAIGARATHSAPVSIPTAGIYLVSACAGNKCSSDVRVTVTPVPARPDLTVDTAGVSDAAVEAGASFTIEATVRNPGNLASDATTLRYVRSDDDTIDTSDTEIATDPVGGLSPGGSSPQSAPVSIADAGTYWVGACAGTVDGEIATDNNCSSGVQVAVTPPALPDLTVDGAAVSTTMPEPGVSFTVEATVRNQGNGASDAATLRYVRSDDATIAASDTEIASAAVGGLAPGGSSGQSAEVSIADAGTYWVGACAGSVDGEATTANNCSAGVLVTVTPLTMPDLTVDGAAVSTAAPEPGAFFTVEATVRNSGSGASEATTLRYYHSDDDTITASDTEIATDPVGGLAPGGSSGQSAEVSIADAGTYWVGACAGTVDGEATTANNCSSGVQVTVALPALPDLAVDTVGVTDAAPEPGASFTIEATVRNSGNGASEATTLRYYRSDDATIDTADTEIASDPVGGLAPGGSSGQSAAVSIADAGTYWVGACAGTVDGETATANNCSAGVQITVSLSVPGNDGLSALPAIIQLLLSP